MLYNALWYFPILMVAGGLSTIIWDYKWLHKAYRSVKSRGRQNDRSEEEGNHDSQEIQTVAAAPSHAITSDSITHRTTAQGHLINGPPAELPRDSVVSEHASSPAASFQPIRFSWKLGITIILAFFVTFIITMGLHGTLHNPPRGFSLFANLYLAGTIIFGGGPVVIPLLREYVVYEGWVSPRDFLLGLAIIQAFPGPNFNFAVYLGSLAVAGSGTDAAVGALIGYIAIFTPGLVLHTGMMGLWKVSRRYRWFTSGWRGINATAIGLIDGGGYRLWGMGY